jgi:ribonuclease III
MTLEKTELGIFYKFRNTDLLKESLIHKSFSNEEGQSDLNNERLEFLGDAVLELVITDILVDLFPEKREGELSKMRSLLVREEALAHIAYKMNLGDCMILGKGEEKSGGRDRSSILAGTLEALLGAVYLDGGYTEAFCVVKKLWGQAIESIHNEDFDIDYKTKLQELVQSKHKTVPTYTVLETKGPAHKRTFSVEVNVHGRSAIGNGRNKKEAEQVAAKNALSTLMQ